MHDILLMVRRDKQLPCGIKHEVLRRMVGSEECRNS